jgi:hypothetical protein
MPFHRHHWFVQVAGAVVCLFLLFPVGVNGQRVGVQLLDAQDRAPLPALLIKVDPGGQFKTDSSGTCFFQAVGPITLSISEPGYELPALTVNIVRDTSLQLLVQRSGTWLADVRMEQALNRSLLTSIECGSVRMDIAQARKLPALLGEPDVFRLVQSLPGIQTSNDGLAGFQVRGGDPSQNLFLYDNAPLINPTHMLDIFSVFQVDAVQSIELHKGPFPANLGGRSASVLDIVPRAVPTDTVLGSAAVGLIGARASLGWGSADGKWTALGAARTTFTGTLARLWNKGLDPNAVDAFAIPQIGFYDGSLHMTGRLDAKNRVDMTLYSGQDKVVIEDFPGWALNYNTHWGNRLAKLGWRHVASEHFFNDLTLYYSDYRYDLRSQSDQFELRLNAGIQELGLRQAGTWLRGSRHVIKFGVEAAGRKMEPRTVQVTVPGRDTLQPRGVQLQGLESAIFVADRFQIHPKFGVSGGIRFSSYLAEAQFKYSWEPRISFNWNLHPRWAIKGGMGRAAQYLFKVSNSQLGLPIDLWYGVDEGLAPQLADHAAIGVIYAPEQAKGMLSIDGFWRRYTGQLQLAEGTPAFADAPVSTLVEVGQTEAAGIELLARYHDRGLALQFSYTLAKATQVFPGKNDGLPFPARFDQRHSAFLTGRYQLNKHWEFSANFTLKSGQSFSVPRAQAYLVDFVPSGIVQGLYYDAFNNFRLPLYHRLDLAATYSFRPRRIHQQLQFSIYNCYNRQNPFFLYFEAQTGPDGIVSAYALRAVTLFPILPALNYQITF